MDDGQAKQSAPGDLELVREFLNTHDVEEGLDEIASPARLAAWLDGKGLAHGDRLSGADVEEAASMRESLRALTLANNGDPLDPEAIPRLNSIAGGARLRVRFDEQGDTALRPAGEGSEEGSKAALGRMLAIVFRAMEDGTAGPAQGLPRRHLPVGVLRPLQEPLGDVVLDGRLREPRKARTYRQHHRGEAKGWVENSMPRNRTSARVVSSGASSQHEVSRVLEERQLRARQLRVEPVCKLQVDERVVRAPHDQGGRAERGDAALVRGQLLEVPRAVEPRGSPPAASRPRTPSSTRRARRRSARSRRSSARPRGSRA